MQGVFARGPTEPGSLSVPTVSVTAVRLTARHLNRTLLLRQHLLGRSSMPPAAMVEHLVGLQAQDQLAPYLSLAARLDPFDPREVSRGLTDRSLVRVLSLRDTVHLHLPDDALTLPVWAAPVRERELGASQTIGSAREVDRRAFAAAVAEVLADGPVTSGWLGEALAVRFPAYAATPLAAVARVTEVLVQCPPRGAWRPGVPTPVVYDHLTRWLDRPLATPDVPSLVRRYLAAYGPGTAADVTAWSGITRLGPVVAAMDDLVRHEDDRGRTLYDVPDAPLADDDVPAPVRLLGAYDNVWLSHGGRDRVTTSEGRALWGLGTRAAHGTVFVDGWLAGAWRIADGRVEVTRLLRDLTPDEQDELDAEVARVEALLDVPAG
jgi:hypothetical protein